MTETWDRTRVQRYIDDEVEEGLMLDYKAADALGKTDGKRKEITKDVSAMANSAGGLIIYGISEFQQAEKKHLPEKLDPIDQTAFSKEWLEQVIMNIRPRIDGVVIHPVSLTGKHVIYVVDIPQGTVAHQAKDYRYYKRFNFHSVPMEDHEIRDVNNRSIVPKVEVSFLSLPHKSDTDGLWLKLLANVSNRGSQAVKYFKLTFSFPDLNRVPLKWVQASTQKNTVGKVKAIGERVHNVEISRKRKVYEVLCRSKGMLFPFDTEEVDANLIFCIFVDEFDLLEMELSIEWILYADNMPPKRGTIFLHKVKRSQN